MPYTQLKKTHKVVLKKLFGEDVDDDDLAELTWQGDLTEFRGEQVASFWPAKLARAQAVFSLAWMLIS